MARRARVEYPGTLYHVIIPSNQRQGIFRDLDTEIPLALALVKPYPSEKMEAYDVSTLMDNPHNDSPECIRPVED